MNFAPHSSACLHWSSVTTVPAPTSISGQFSLTALMESAAAAVRNVISITLTPPANSAFAVGKAFAVSSNTTTGITPDFFINCKTTNNSSTSFPIYRFYEKHYSHAYRRSHPAKSITLSRVKVCAAFSKKVYCFVQFRFAKSFSTDFAGQISSFPPADSMTGTCILCTCESVSTYPSRFQNS